MFSSGEIDYIWGFGEEVSNDQLANTTSSEQTKNKPSNWRCGYLKEKE